MVKLPPGTPILHMDAPDFAEKLADAIGVTTGDTIEIITPQFEREDGLKPQPIPEDLDNLKNLSADRLAQIGCRKWDDPDENGNVLWLLPYQWYDSIPEGFMLTCIDGTTEPFRKGVTDDDYRAGCLAYGVLVHTPQETQ